MKITKRQLRRIIREAMEEVSMYDQGREDSLAKIRPQLPDEEYMRGYNEAQADAGLPTMQAPSDSGRGKKLDPNKLKGALAGKHYGRRMTEEDEVPMLKVGDLDKGKEAKGMYGQSMKKKKKKK